MEINRFIADNNEILPGGDNAGRRLLSGRYIPVVLGHSKRLDFLSAI